MFAILTVILVLINIPLFLNIIMPMQDTLDGFQVFYFFYNEIFFNKELPLWVPFGMYGMPSDSLLVGGMSPSSWLAGFIGWILGIRNVLLVFKFSLFFEQLVFLLGVYLLSKSLFKHKTSIFFVCITGIGSQFLLSQICFNFRVYSYIPLIIYFIIRSFSEYKPQYLILAMNIYIISLFSLWYQAPISFLPIGIISTVLLVGNFRNLLNFLNLTPKDILITFIYILSLAILASTYYFFMNNISNFHASLTPGRNNLTKFVDLDTFLTYGGNTGFIKFKEIILPIGKWIPLEITLFIGLIPLVFMIYGLIKVRNLVQFSFALVIVVFGLLSVGKSTPVAQALYDYFPLMKYFRHIGYVVPNFKLFFPLMAGFGLDYFLSQANACRADLNKASRIVLIIGVVILTFFLSELLTNAEVYYIVIALGLIFFLSGLLIKIYNDKSKFFTNHFVFFIIFCVILELFVYNVMLINRFYPLTRILQPVIRFAEVNKYDFPLKRSISPSNTRANTILPYLVEAKNNTFIPNEIYNNSYYFMQWDPCSPYFRTNIISKDILTLVKLKSGSTDIRRFLPDDINFLHNIGCESPKLKLISDAVFTDNLNETMKILSSRDKVAIHNVPERLQFMQKSEKNDERISEVFNSNSLVHVISNNPNEINIEVYSPKNGAWLYYADAWHPSWRAFVNNKSAYVFQANIAFKAIRVESGINEVRLVFDNKKSKLLGYIIIFAGVLFMVMVLTSVGINIFKPIGPFK